MRTVAFRHLLDNDNALRVSFVTEHGQIVSFIVQLECRFKDNDWVPVVRYDTAHGYAHRDTMHPHKKATKTKLPVQDLNQALTIAMHDVAESRHDYRRRYEEWLKQK